MTDLAGVPVDSTTIAPKPEYPAVIKAAIAHAQFETIHPFLDGNGRTGRALVHVLAGLQAEVPPISLVLMADRERYIERLGAYRSAEDESSDFAVDPWVDYFAQALVSACARAEALDGILDGVRGHWYDRVRFRRGSAGERILQVLISNPVVTVARAAELTGSSGEACRLAIKGLVEAGILVQSARNRKSDLYVAQDVVGALASFERAAARGVAPRRKSDRRLTFRKESRERSIFPGSTDARESFRTHRFPIGK